MPKRRSMQTRSRPLDNSGPRNVIQANKSYSNQIDTDNAPSHVCRDISNVKPILDDEKLEPAPSTSTDLSNSAAALHDELDSFRQRWKRELEVKRPSEPPDVIDRTVSNDGASKENRIVTLDTQSRDSRNDANDVYALAKKLFLMGVDLEQDEMHHESIRYYKQAMHLYPDIERQIFREQCEASVKLSNANKDTCEQSTGNDIEPLDHDIDLPILEKVKDAFQESSRDGFGCCYPANKLKTGAMHIRDLPHDLILVIFRYVIGEELDLASLESLGLVCRGFYIITHDPSLWRSICYTTWPANTLSVTVQQSGDNLKNMDWKQLYLTRPRVNFDGVYISRTRYIRQGDVGFQDITYRPFHIVRYYRYLRFFPDNRVLLLTTNEEPDKIIPIFRHALHAKQFASELSILEGTYELIDEDELIIKAERDFTQENNQTQHQTYNQRRQARFHWSRQTPLRQNFYMKFRLKTSESRPYTNNVLKWLEYSILAKTEIGNELTEFDVSPDTFPSLTFSRVKKFNLKLSRPLSNF